MQKADAQITEQFTDESESRKKVVGEQREIEELLAGDKNGRAVFFVNFPLTPIYINPEAVQQNPQSKLYELKPGYEKAIPAGLIPDDKLKDPEQLSTVLGRVLTLWELQQNPIIIFYVEDRVDEKGKPVNTKQFDEFKKQHPNVDLQKIDKADYTPNIGKIAEATYAYHKNNQSETECIFASQIIDPNRPSAWQILKAEAARVPVKNVNALLIKYGKEPIPLPLGTNTQVPGKSSLFTPLSANEPINPSSSPAETCRPSTTLSK